MQRLQELNSKLLQKVKENEKSEAQINRNYNQI